MSFRKTISFSALFALSAGVLYFSTAPYLAAQFGISAYAARQIIDIASGAGSVWAVIAVVGGSAGWGAALLAAAKYFIKRFGRAAAASW